METGSLKGSVMFRECNIKHGEGRVLLEDSENYRGVTVSGLTR